jgi:hypothetical protein
MNLVEPNLGPGAEQRFQIPQIRSDEEPLAKGLCILAWDCAAHIRVSFLKNLKVSEGFPTCQGIIINVSGLNFGGSKMINRPNGG